MDARNLPLKDGCLHAIVEKGMVALAHSRCWVYMWTALHFTVIKTLHCNPTPTHLHLKPCLRNGRMTLAPRSMFIFPHVDAFTAGSRCPVSAPHTIAAIPSP